MRLCDMALKKAGHLPTDQAHQQVLGWEHNPVIFYQSFIQTRKLIYQRYVVESTAANVMFIKNM